MSEYLKVAAEFGDRYLASLAESQEQFLKSLAPGSQWTAGMPKPEVPANMPTPQEIVESNFAFTGKLLQQQQKFLSRVLAATTPTA